MPVKASNSNESKAKNKSAADRISNSTFNPVRVLRMPKRDLKLQIKGTR